LMPRGMLFNRRKLVAFRKFPLDDPVNTLDDPVNTNASKG